MDYEKLYKEALSRARNHKNNDGLTLEQYQTIDLLFPELADSEDEKIRKEIISALKWANHKGIYDKHIAWLEKQSEQKPVISDDALREGITRFGITQYQIDNWLKKYIIGVEKQCENKPADNKEKLDVLNFIRKEACCGLAEANNALLKLIKVLKEHPFPIMDKSYKLKIEWEEQQDEQPKEFTYTHEVEVGNGNIKGLVTEKVQLPKFKNGDWIVWQDKCYKVNYNGCGYELIDQNGLSTTLEYGTIDEGAHLWTIQDVKDGDVLADLDGGIFIYAGSTDVYTQFYVALGRHGDLYTPTDPGNWAEKNRVYPATKEQRDILFTKMKVLGCEWDADEKRFI